MIRLAVRVSADQAEVVLAELLELAPGGVEEVDRGAGVTEYAVYGAPGELPTLPDLRAAAGGALVEVSSSEIADDWVERWREFHRPVVVGGRLRIRPPWELAAGTPIELVIDPGRAFGTGAHATTRLCLELMLELAPGGGFVDLGCGSGILAITAARLGWSPVLALDNDRLSIEATVANAKVNGVALAVRCFDLREANTSAGAASPHGRTEPVPDPLEAAGTLVANLLGPLLLELAQRFVQRCRHPPRQLIVGGLLVAEADRIAAAFARSGLTEVRRHERGEWAALLLAPGG